MKRPKTMKLMLSKTVYKAYEADEVSTWNAYSWATKYNGGMEDKRLQREVYELCEYFEWCGWKNIEVTW